MSRSSFSAATCSLKASAFPLRQLALLLCDGERLADAIAASGLDLAGQPANIVFKLPDLIVAIGESLFKALATRLTALDLGRIGRRLAHRSEGG